MVLRFYEIRSCPHKEDGTWEEEREGDDEIEVWPAACKQE